MRRRDRNAAVPGRRVRKQIEVKVSAEEERAERLLRVPGKLEEVLSECVARLLVEGAKEGWSKKAKTFLRLMETILGVEGETQKPRRREKKSAKAESADETTCNPGLELLLSYLEEGS